ncbi:MAG: hypothetical protein ACRBI6_02675 [Acidimicrobiales bacterium]
MRDGARTTRTAGLRRSVAAAAALFVAACTSGGGGAVGAPADAATPETTTPTTAAPTTGAPTTTTTTIPTTVLPEDPTERWQALLAEVGTELPGGGTEIFPDRRIVMLYGHPATHRLGILGEYRLDGAIAAVEALAAEFETAGFETEAADAVPVVPAFEIIATVATRAPGDDEDYSKESTVDELRPWVEAIGEAGGFAVLDLQPGRTDFVTQARRYEELLRLPYVGLALDPEWRLEPDEVHLRQIGSVSADEVNRVVEYLVGLVHEDVLPQKLLVLHQFQHTMLPDRELIATPPELAVVLHVDGQGPLGSKYGTYDEMVTAPMGPGQTLWWGWKNFHDEDSPMATPAQTNAVEPLPMVVSYQ